MGPRSNWLLVGAFALTVGLTVPARADDWPMFQQNPSHTAHVTSSSDLNAVKAATLIPKWFTSTSAPVSATPTVVNVIIGNSSSPRPVVYVGDFTGIFHALDAATGHELWSFDITHNLYYDDRHSVSYGEIVSSAAYADVPSLGPTVFFGGGGTLWALDATNGTPRWWQDVDPENPTSVVEIESSPVVSPSGTHVYVGMDVNEAANVAHAGVLAFNAVPTSAGSHHPVFLWKFDTTLGQPVYDLNAYAGSGGGCGGVWSSPALDQENGLLFFGTSNCPDQSTTEAIWSIDTDGNFKWAYHPRPPGSFDPDQDFGSSPVLFNLNDANKTPVVAEAGKDGFLYVLDRSSGAVIHAVQGAQAGQTGPAAFGAIGGFIGSPALGSSIFAGSDPVIFATSAAPTPFSAGGLSSNGGLDPTIVTCLADNSAFPCPLRASGLHAIDAATGRVLWHQPLHAPSYGHVTYANGVVFAAATFGFSLAAYDATTGAPIWRFPLGGAASSGVAIAGDSVYVGAGTGEGSFDAGPLGTQYVPPQVNGVWSFAPATTSPERLGLPLI